MYVLHCHLLGHEPNEMLRPMLSGIAPISPTIGTAMEGKGKNTDSVITTFTPGLRR